MPMPKPVKYYTSLLSEALCTPLKQLDPGIAFAVAALSR